MIPFGPLITHLRATCPSFQRRVGGTAAYAAAMKTQGSTLAVPYCFIVPTQEANVTDWALFQEHDIDETIRDYFATIICIDNRANKEMSGEGSMNIEPLDQLRALRREVGAALAGFQMLNQVQPVRFYRGKNMGMDNVRLWWEWQWYADHYESANTDANQEAIATVVEGVNEDNGVAPNITTVQITEHIQPDPLYSDLVLGPTDTLYDGFPPGVANPGVVDAGDPARATKRTKALAVQVADIIHGTAADFPDDRVHEQEIETAATVAPAPPSDGVLHGETTHEEDKK